MAKATIKVTTPKQGGRDYVIDHETRNMSFLQTHYDLKRLGIRENNFFLRLYNPMLRGVDPHSPFLDEGTILDIITECYINPWYFLREVVRVRGL